MLKSKLKRVIITTGVMGMTLSATAMPFMAHGYVNSPPSRVYTGHTIDRSEQKYGVAVNEPQSLEAPKGFPLNGPKDGEIASAGGVRGRELDTQKANYWIESDIKTGPQQFTWTFTAPHKTTKWHYYMTKPSWNVNEPLTRNNLELIGTINHDGTAASSNPTHTVDIPANRSGSNVILAVWDVADTEGAFYQVIDVNVKNDGSSANVVAPSNLVSSDVSYDSAKLSWKGQPNQTYAIFRDGIEIAKTDQESFVDKNLTEATQYSYYVKALDAAGNTSKASNAVNVKTSKNPTNAKPLAPTGLHTMNVTDSLVSLMWTEREASMEYAIFRDGIEIGKTKAKSYDDKNVTPETAYRYEVRAINSKGIVSEVSSAVDVKTPAKEQNNKPLAPTGLHAMGVTDKNVKLMFKQNAPNLTYIIFRDGIEIGKTKERSFTDQTVEAGKAYSYAVKGVDAKGFETELSNTLNVKTPDSKPTGLRTFKLGTFSNPELYRVGEKVSHNGKTYTVRQTHNNYGDANWSPNSALSLFK
ncbi:MAG: lytic polysaccharide monooxygenase [Culicoidibacterales bacterium]